MTAHEATAADFAWCEGVIRKSSRSFYRAFSLLPERKRQAVFAVYAFCRMADDAVDAYVSPARLESLRRDLARFCAGEAPDTALWRALGTSFARFGLDERPFFDQLEGQRRDLTFHQPRTMAELEEYSYYVAGSVGLMLLPLLAADAGVDGDLRGDAVALGVAMQLTNILRDVGEDLDAGRVYLPASVLDAARGSRASLAARRADGAFCAAWEAVARRSEELYRPLERDIARLDEDSRLPVLSSLYLYRGILDAVRAAGYRCFDWRCAVPPARAEALAAAAAMRLGSPAGAQAGREVRR